MPELRAMLAAGGFADPRTYLQSGNVVLESDAAPEVVASDCERLVAAAFGLRIDVVARTRDQRVGSDAPPTMLVGVAEENAQKRLLAFQFHASAHPCQPRANTHG